MLYLIASFIALLIGPLCYRFLASGTGLQKGLDGFIFVALGGLVLIHILPELLEHGGLASLIFVVIGLWGPTASEKLFHRYSEVTHNVTLVLGVFGLLLHTLTDGGALVLAGQPENSQLLALGIILHRLPVGIAIWWLLKPQVGSRWASIVIGFMMLLTAIGYFVGEQWLSQLSLDNTVYLQAFVTGSILHVVLHQPHVQQTADKKGRYDYHAGIGSLLGVGLLLMLLSIETGNHQHDAHGHDITEFWRWAATLAPVLVAVIIAATVRFQLGLTPKSSNPAILWIQQLIGPESLLLVGIFLGIEYLIAQTIVCGILISLLSLKRICPVFHDADSQSSWQFGLEWLINQSAPWILLSLIATNLVSQTSFLVGQPLLQVLLLAPVFIVFRVNHIGAAILAIALSYCSWSNESIIFALVAAPLISVSQIKHFSWPIKSTVLVVILACLVIFGYLELQPHVLFVLPESINVVAIVILAALFAASLLRLGPRAFLKPLMIVRPHKHHH